MNQLWYEKVLNKVVAFSRILLLFFLTVVAVQSLTTYPDAEFLQRTQSKPVLMLLVLFCSFVILFLLRYIYKVLDQVPVMVLRGICVVAPAIIIIGQLIFLLYYRSLYMWDTAYVVGGASELLRSGEVAKEAYYYYSIYPNQNAFAILTRELLRIAGFMGMDSTQTQLFCNFVNMIGIDVAIMFGMLIWKRLKKDYTLKNWAFNWIIMMIQPFFYIGVSYYYTITLSLPFLMGALYVVSRMFSVPKESEEYVANTLKDYTKIKLWTRKIGMSLLAGILFGVGFLLRATTIIGLVAVVCCALLVQDAEGTDMDTIRRKQLVGAFFICIVFAVTVVGGNHVIQKQIGIDTTDTAFPASHWVMMSLTSPGCHNAEDEAYTASFPTKAEKQEAVKSRIKEKIQNLGAAGCFLLMFDKLENTWASGANCYVLFMENCMRMDGVYPYLFGNHKDFMILYQQGLHFLIIIGIFCSVWYRFRRKGENDRDYFLLQLVLLGGFLFYLLWETSGQYSLPFFIIMLFLCVDGYEILFSKKEEMPYRVEKLHGQYNIFADEHSVFWHKFAIGMGMFFLVFFAVFTVKNYKTCTTLEENYKAPVVNQLIANGEVELREGELTQTFQTKDSFNQVIFQWRNPIGENNGAVYEVSLLGENGNQIWKQQIVPKGSGYSGAFLYDFDMITPVKEEKFTLSIVKTEGTSEEYLQFVEYRCGTYNPYPFGECAIRGELQDGGLMFQVARLEHKSYTTSGSYIVCMGGFMIVFLFLEICSILAVCGRLKKKAT